MMNFKQDENMLELLHDGSMTTEVSVEDGVVAFFSIFYDYDSNYISFSAEEWEKVKGWVDKKIAEESVSESVSEKF